MATSEHFSDVELRCKGNDCGLPGCPLNECSQSLVDVLEAFRAAVGQPVIVDDAFRCAHHNGSISTAAKRSQHVQGMAADIKVAGMTAVQLEAVALKIPAIRGIGRDDHKNYLHIDVRQQSALARWCYGISGSEIAYYPPPDPPIATENV